MDERISRLALMQRQHMLDVINYIHDNKVAICAYMRSQPDFPTEEMKDSFIIESIFRHTASDALQMWTAAFTMPVDHFVTVHALWISQTNELTKLAEKNGVAVI